MTLKEAIAKKRELIESLAELDLHSDFTEHNEKGKLKKIVFVIEIEVD